MTFRGIWIRAIARVWYHRSRLVVAHSILGSVEPRLRGVYLHSNLRAFGMTLIDLLASRRADLCSARACHYRVARRAAMGHNHVA